MRIRTLTLSALAPALAALLVAPATRAQDTDDERPNVVLIVGEGLTAAAIEPTPPAALLSLAADGVTLTDHYPGSPLGSAARIVLLTGHPWRISPAQRASGRPQLRRHDITVAELLRDAGYATGYVGKWDMGPPMPPDGPRQNGFSYFLTFERQDDGEPQLLASQLRRVVATPQPLPDQLHDAALAYLRRRHTKPFFLCYAPPPQPLTDLDQRVADTLATLQQRDLESDTIVIFASVPAPGAPALERSVGVIRWPGHLPRGTRCEARSSQADLLATVAELTSVAAPVLAGPSLVPVVRDPSIPAPRRTLRWIWPGGEAALWQGWLGERSVAADGAPGAIELRPLSPTDAPASDADRAAATTAIAALLGRASGDPVPGFAGRPPTSEAEMWRWLDNMVGAHGFAVPEIAAATSQAPAAIDRALERWTRDAPRPAEPQDGRAPLRVMPWPGGRALSNEILNPSRRRESKVSVFAPWDPAAYVVLDVPEAVWSNFGLMYLAHQDHKARRGGFQQQHELEDLEWTRADDGRLRLHRSLAHDVTLTADIVPRDHAVRMRLALRNGWGLTLEDLRVQACVFLRALGPTFADPAQSRIVQTAPYAATGSADGQRWVITAWEPHSWFARNPRHPCMHSNPKLPACPPGATRHAFGWLSFYEGEDIAGEIRRIDGTGWRDDRWDGDQPH
ncbi:MAG: sulfatase-like hydrolase/transferase [Planctomycetota bacterium]